MKKNLEQKYQNNLKILRTKHGLLQKEVAQLLGFRTEDRICRWERGQSIPSLPNLLKLTKLFSVDTKDLYPDL
ncbi:MAG: helix-turn-helix transcriptional regulator [Bacteroidetes bacterium]|nr:helix-turn-helix transcriptional regulator [Bacteroidota bacterium]